MLLFGDLRFVPNDPTTIGACFAAQIEELITIDRSISLLCLLLLRALFFYIARGCVAQAVFQEKNSFDCCGLFAKKKEKSEESESELVEKENQKFVHVVSPPLHGQPRIQNQRKLVRVLWRKIFQFSLPLHKIKTLLKEYSLIHAHAPHHKKETSSGDTPPFDLLKPFRVLKTDTGE